MSTEMKAHLQKQLALTYSVLEIMYDYKINPLTLQLHAFQSSLSALYKPAALSWHA